MPDPATAADPPPPAVRWGLVLPAFASLLIFGLGDNVRGPILPAMIGDLTLSDTEAGLTFSATSLGVAGGSLGCRPLVRRWGGLAAQQVGLLVLAAGVVVMGLAPGLGVLLGGSLVLGVGMGSQAVTHNLLVAEGTRTDLRRRALSALHAMYGLASLTAPLGVTVLYALGLSWRGCLLLLAAAPLALFAASLAAPAGPRPAPPEGGAPPLRAALTVMALGALYVTAELLLSTRLVLLLRREGYAQDPAAVALTAFFTCLLIGRLTFGVLRTRAPTRTLLAGCAAGGLVLLALGLAWWPLLLPLAGLPMAPFFPLLMDLAAEEFPGRVEAVVGRTFAAVSVCLVGAHYAVGLVSDVVSLRVALGVGPLALALALVVLAGTGLGRGRTGPKPPSPGAGATRPRPR